MLPREARGVLIAGLVGGVVLLGLSGCGGGGSTAHTSSSSSPAARAAWASRTETLCREKRAAIARLGYVHITYAGIARAGMPAVKRSLDRYLGRLLAVLSRFSHKQRQVTPPPSLVSTMNTAYEVDSQSQAATRTVRRAVAGVKTPSQLSAAFSIWLTNLQRLAARGDAIAQQLSLPGCRSASAASSP